MEKLIGVVLALLVLAAPILVIKEQNESMHAWVEFEQTDTANIYIDGEPVSNQFNTNAIDKGNYTIEQDGDNIYLTTKQNRSGTRIMLIPHIQM